MTDYVVANPVVDTTVNGGAAFDRLFLTYTTDGGVTNSLSGNAAGYSGTFVGPGATDDVVFTGIEAFFFDHTAGTGADSILTGAGSDSIRTGAGNDTIFSGSGSDTIDGGAGIDLWGADLSAFFSAGIDLNQVFGTLITNVEGFGGLIGSPGSDRFVGTALSGSTLNASGGNDEIVLFGDAGPNSVSGGAGSDLLTVTFTANQPVTTTITGSLVAGYSGTHAGTSFTTSFDTIERFSITTAGGADSILTGDGNDTISTGFGNDTISSGKGFDSIDGGAGIDLWTADLSSYNSVFVDLSQGFGPVRNIEGFLGLIGSSGNDSLIGTALSGSTLNAAGGADFIAVYQSGGPNSVDGGAGDDTLEYRAAAPFAFSQVALLPDGLTGGFLGAGGPEDDTSFTGIDRIRIVFTGPAALSFAGSVLPDNVSGGSGDDTIGGAGGRDFVDGGGGNDFLIGSLGTPGEYDDLFGGAARDVVTYAARNSAVYVSLRGAAAVDKATGALLDRLTGIEDVIGTTGSDVLVGDDEANAMHGNGGGDQLYGYDGDDVVDGGTGVAGVYNLVFGGGDQDTISYAGQSAPVYVDLRTSAGFVGGELADLLNSIENATGGAGDDTLVGNDVPGDRNILAGGAGSDILSGLAGDDVLIGGSAGPGGYNQLFGGEGQDTASYAGTMASVYADLRSDVGLVAGVLTDAFSSVEHLIGGSGDDLLVGDDGENLLQGGGGSDQLYGFGGNDRFLGGTAAPGTDNLVFGGGGQDTIDYSGQTADVFVDLRGPAGYVGGARTDLMNSIENVVGGSGNDVLVGTDLPGESNLLIGGAGADLLFGLAGDDLLIGGAALPGSPNQLFGGEGLDTASYQGANGQVVADLLFGFGLVGGVLTDRYDGVENLLGGLGEDRLSGDGSANVLTGAGGADVLAGRGGPDRFVYDAASDSGYPSGYDTIVDFEKGALIGGVYVTADLLDLSGLGIDASRVLITSGGGATALYADTGPPGDGFDFAIAFNGANAITLADIVF